MRLPGSGTRRPCAPHTPAPGRATASASASASVPYAAALTRAEALAQGAALIAHGVDGVQLPALVHQVLQRGGCRGWRWQEGGGVVGGGRAVGWWGSQWEASRHTKQG